MYKLSAIFCNHVMGTPSPDDHMDPLFCPTHESINESENVSSQMAAKDVSYGTPRT